MKEKRHDDVILKPEPIKGFSKEKVLYIPVDSPSMFIQKSTKKSVVKEKNTPFGHLFLLENKIVFHQCIGAPLAVLSLERLIVSGAKEIIILGFCGTLNPDAKIMDMVSIQKAHSEEGTSRHYFSRKNVFYPSPILKKKTEIVLSDMKLPYLKGALVSTDAPYRETKSWMTQKQKRGIGFVDMETSAVFALAEYYGIQAAALMLVSDDLTTAKWKAGFHHSQMDEKIKAYFLPFLK